MILRTIINSVVFILSVTNILAQKPVLENRRYTNDWTNLKAREIAPNGNYICYSFGSGLNEDLVIIGTANLQQADTIKNAGSPRFSSDSRSLFFSKSGDTLVKLDLISKKYQFETKVSSWQLLQVGNNEFLVFQRSHRQLHITNTVTLDSTVLDSVNNFKIDTASKNIAITDTHGLSLISLLTFNKRRIASSDNLSAIQFEPNGRSLFFYDESNGKLACLYDINEGKLKTLFNNESPSIPLGYEFSGIPPLFASNGDRLIFTFRKKADIPLTHTYGVAPNMFIWNHNDILIPKFALNFNIAISAIEVNVDTAHLKVIASGNVKLLGVLENNRRGKNAKTNLLIKFYNESDDRVYYQTDKSPDFKSYSFAENSFRTIVSKNNGVKSQTLYVSPSGRFAYWYDMALGDFFCYDVYEHRTVNTTEKIKLSNDMKSFDTGAYPYRLDSHYHLKWLANDEKFFVRDKYDLWEIDPTGTVAPINLTGGYGRKHKIEFRFIDEENTSKMHDGDEMFITAMNERKNNGFAKVTFGSKAAFKMGKLYDKLFYWNIGDTERTFKKSGVNILVVGQTASEGPNLYLVSNLLVYHKVSHIYPEKKYNWLTAELIRYPMKQRKIGTAILYKPENFDPRKKYPVIFTYYQVRSERLHQFHEPGVEVNINIPFYVSNGYLVVVPDIRNDEPGEIATATVSSITSSVDYLKQYPWFDISKMGAQGQSMGGYETNILIANTNLFAAAQSFAGVSNFTVFGQVFGNATFAENGQPNFNTTLWENPALYIKNSPLFQLNRVRTPLLLLHGRKDGAVDFNQSESMFYALQRLRKPVWLIEYEGAGHADFGEENGDSDFNLRRQQFFDHYLKGKPMPMWMKESGNLSLDLDTTKTN